MQGTSFRGRRVRRQSVTNVTSPELAATLNGINRGIGSLGLRLLGS